MIETLPELADIALSTDGDPFLTDVGAAAIALGLAAIATAYAQRGIGSAAVGAVAEDDDNFINALIFVALPETLIILAFVVVALVLFV